MNKGMFAKLKQKIADEDTETFFPTMPGKIIAKRSIPISNEKNVDKSDLNMLEKNDIPQKDNIILSDNACSLNSSCEKIVEKCSINDSSEFINEIKLLKGQLNESNEKIKKLEEKIQMHREGYSPDTTTIHNENDLLKMKLLNLKNENEIKLQRFNEEISELKLKLNKELLSNKELKIEMETDKDKFDKLKKEYDICQKEKNELLIEYKKYKVTIEKVTDHNAKLQTELRHSTAEWDCLKEETSQLTLKNETLVKDINSMKLKCQSENDLSKDLQIQKERNENLCQEINKLTKQLTSLENNLDDRSKTVKLQQQRLNEMKKTLQKELRVQTLPMDIAAFQTSAKKNENVSLVSSSSMLENNDSVTITKNNDINCSNDNFVNCRVCDHLNYEYLRHVVIKFLLSRETEAIHLIKAITVLLHLTADEQKLIKDTLEYRSSWFGSKPSIQVNGQRAKIVPPS